NDLSADPVALATPPELPKIAPNPETPPPTAAAQPAKPVQQPRAELLDTGPIAEVVELPAAVRQPRVQPAVLVSPKPVVAAEKRTHTVQFGESLWTISKKYLGNGELYSKLAECNGITVKDKIKLGQVLVIPDLNSPIPAIATAPARLPEPAEADHE